MTLTTADIEVHKRLIRSYERQADQLARRIQDDEKQLLALERAIGNEEALLRAEGVNI